MDGYPRMRMRNRTVSELPAPLNSAICRSKIIGGTAKGNRKWGRGGWYLVVFRIIGSRALKNVHKLYVEAGNTANVRCGTQENERKMTKTTPAKLCKTTVDNHASIW